MQKFFPAAPQNAVLIPLRLPEAEVATKSLFLVE